ncbi:TRAP transporter small permease [Jiangella anatolica]|uniref:TRAP transporter small permease n=1 Tax=Jiangella anatolica TaxID=2670374 RepID=UPI001314B2F0|nr:TRAP transporter small permease subunit [Jiangella anatolica]
MTAATRDTGPTTSTPKRRALPAWTARPIRVLTAIELGIGALALVIIFVLLLVQTLQRYLPLDGWPWTGELARFCLVWLTFVVAGVLVTRDSHISIEMIDGVGSPVVRRIVRVVSCLIVAAVGVGLTAEALALVEDQGILKSPAMGMPMSWLYGISLIGFVSTTLRALVAAVDYGLNGAPAPQYDDLDVMAE